MTPESVLQGAQADQITKANAWEAFHNATSQQDFESRLGAMNLPQEVKAQLWEIKYSPASQVGAFQSKPGAPIQNINQEITSPEAMLARAQQQAHEALSRPFQSQVEQVNRQQAAINQRLGLNLSPEETRALVASKFPGAVFPGTDPSMRQAAAPQIVRAATGSLPAAGAAAGGTLAAPGVVSTPLGVGLGMGVGRTAQLAANHLIFGPDETAPGSAEGLKSAGEYALAGGLTEGVIGGVARGVSAATPEELAATGQTKLAQALRTPAGRYGTRAAKMLDDIDTATPDLAQISRQAPISKAGIIKRMTGKGDPGWFSEAAENIDNYKQGLWEKGHIDIVQHHAQEPFDNQAVLRKTLDEILPQDDVGQSRMATQWAQREIPRLNTLQDADTKIRLLNADIKALPEKYGPVGVRVRVAAVQAIRQQLDSQLVADGEEGVIDVNRRWGALNNIQNRLMERYFQETGKASKAGWLPDWFHAYAFAHPGGMAVGTGIRVGRAFLPDDPTVLGRAMNALSKTGLEPPPIQGPFRPSGPGIPPSVAPTISGESLARVPGRTYQGPPPTPIQAGPIPSESGAKITTGLTPEQQLRGTTAQRTGRLLPPAPTRMSATSPPEGGAMPQTEQRLAQQLKRGDITQEDVMNMAKNGDILWDAPRRIFRAAQRGVKAPPPTSAQQYLNRKAK